MSGIVTHGAVNNAAEAHTIGLPDRRTANSPRREVLAGIAAIGAGIAWIIWAAINTRTRGGLDAGAAAVGEPVARLGALLMVAWNLLLLPAAIALDTRMRGR